MACSSPSGPRTTSGRLALLPARMRARSPTRSCPPTASLTAASKRARAATSCRVESLDDLGWRAQAAPHRPIGSDKAVRVALPGRSRPSTGLRLCPNPNRISAPHQPTTRFHAKVIAASPFSSVPSIDHPDPTRSCDPLDELPTEPRPPTRSIDQSPGRTDRSPTDVSAFAAESAVTAVRYSPPGPNTQRGKPDPLSLTVTAAASLRCGSVSLLRSACRILSISDHRVSPFGSVRGTRPADAFLFTFCTAIIYPNYVRTSSASRDFFLLVRQEVTLSDRHAISGPRQHLRPKAWGISAATPQGQES